MKYYYSKKNHTSRSYLALAIATALSSSLVLAEEAVDASPAAQEKGLERIEVTARKTVETLQSVPVAITSIGAAELSENGISVMTEIQQFSPNTTLQSSRGTNSTLTAFIRGVGQEDPLWGYDQGVGIYIDDVYVSRPQGGVLDIIDVERVEVLRGPQGSLYGKNTIGGAIKYVTKKMAGDLEFDLKGTVGDYGRKDYKVAGKLPVIEDKLYVGFALASLSRDGFGDFLVAPEGEDTENYNKDVFAGRLTVEFTPNDDWFFRFNYDKTIDDSNAKGGYRVVPSILTDKAPIPDSVYDSYTSLPTWNSVESEGMSLTAEYYINDDWSMKSVTSSRESYSKTNIDFDNTPLQIFDVPAIYDDEQFSQEFQLNYSSADLTFVSGLYYFDSESCGHYDAIIYQSLTAEKAGCNNSESYAIYAQGSYNVNDKLSFTLGGRFTDEEKSANVIDTLFTAIEYPESDWISGYTRGDLEQLEVLNNSKSWSSFNPKVGVEYQIDDDMMVFASYAQGFKSGTFNPRASTNEPAVNPETVDSVEIGIKSEWFNKLRINATVFALEHKDRQYTSVVANDDPSILDQRLGNIGKSEAAGLELEVEYAATESLNFNFSFGYIDSEFTEVLSWNGNDYDDISDTYTVANTPDTTANFGITYDFETTVGTFVVNGNYYYRGDYDLVEIGNVLVQDAYGIVNLGVNWYSNNGDWTAALHLKNITDEEYMVGAYNFTDGQDESGAWLPGFGGDTTLITYFGDPSTIALTVGYTF